MSTSYESKILVGAYLTDMYEALTEEFKEKHEFEDIWDYRDYLWSIDGDMVCCHSTCGFFGLETADSMIKIDQLNLFAFHIQELAQDFKAYTGFDAKMKSVVWSY